MSHQAKRNVSDILPQFLEELRDYKSFSILSHGRVLRFNSHIVQVFCTLKRRVIVSRDYFIAKGDSFNREIVAADISRDYLMLTLRKNKTTINTIFVQLANNQDVGEMTTERLYKKIVQLEDYLTPTASTMSIIAVDSHSSRTISLLQPQQCRS